MFHPLIGVDCKAVAVRRIPKNYRNVTGIVASGKTPSPAEYESTLERDFLTLLEFAPHVQTFDVQPVAISWNDAGQTRRYTPDTLVHYEPADGLTPVPELYEVKYREDLRKEWTALKPKFRAAIRFAKAQGWRFRLMTEVEIRTPYLTNAKFLLPFAKRRTDLDQCKLLMDRMAELRETTPATLLVAICHDDLNRAALLPALWHLIGTFRIGSDLHTPLTMASRIWSKE